MHSRPPEAVPQCSLAMQQLVHSGNYAAQMKAAGAASGTDLRVNLRAEALRYLHAARQAAQLDFGCKPGGDRVGGLEQLLLHLSKLTPPKVPGHSACRGAGKANTVFPPERHCSCLVSSLYKD